MGTRRTPASASTPDPAAAEVEAQTAGATEVADTTPAAPADDPATKGTEDSGDADHVAAVPTGDGSDDQVDPRAGALANLVAGLGAGDETSGGEVAQVAAPAPSPLHDGQDWGGDLPHIVLAHEYHALVDKSRVSAPYGEVVLVTAAEAKRGVSLGALKPVD
jgi:hypothetical protein